MWLLLMNLQLLPTIQHNEDDVKDFRNRSSKLVKQWMEQQQHVCSLPPSLIRINVSDSSCDNNCIAVIR